MTEAVAYKPAIETPAPDVVAFRTKNRAEIDRIMLLQPQEQESEFADFIINQVDHISRLEPREQQEALTTLTKWEVDRIVGLDGVRQKAVIEAKYDMKPEELEKYYEPLQAKSRELHKRGMAAGKAMGIVGWSALFGTLLGTTLIKFGKNNNSLREKVSDSRIVQWFFVGISSLFIGFISAFASARIFGRKIKEESEALAIAASNVFKRELTDDVGDKLRELLARKVEESKPVAPAEGATAGIEKKTPPKPRENYTAEAAKAKAAAQGAGAAVG